MQYALGGIDVKDLRDKDVTFGPEQGFPVPYDSLTFHGLWYHSRMHSFETDISLVTAEERSIQPSCQNASASMSRARDGSKVEPSSNFQPPTPNSDKSRESSQVQQAMHVL